MGGLTSQPELTKKTFHEISALVREKAGIHLHDGKFELVKARLNKRLRELGYEDYNQYMQYLKADNSGSELVEMLDSISTNVTSFFRESSHFDYIAQNVLPTIKERKLRIWSAGCSTGQEPYTASIMFLEKIQNIQLWDIKILATDLSTKVLRAAKDGFYTESQIGDISSHLKYKYFEQAMKEDSNGFRILPIVKQYVKFARLNLLEAWPMKGPFDIIFCRNVMIYFEKDIRERLINNYWTMLRPGGKLFIGHSESLTSIKHKFEYIEPTIYEKR